MGEWERVGEAGERFAGKVRGDYGATLVGKEDNGSSVIGDNGKKSMQPLFTVTRVLIILNVI